MTTDPDLCPACGAGRLKLIEADANVSTDQLACEACGGMFDARSLPKKKKKERDDQALVLKEIERELARLGVDGRGGSERLVVEAGTYGRCSIKCSTGSLMTKCAEILSRLRSLPNNAGFSEIWTELFDFPETPDCFD